MKDMQIIGILVIVLAIFLLIIELIKAWFINKKLGTKDKIKIILVIVCILVILGLLIF